MGCVLGRDWGWGLEHPSPTPPCCTSTADCGWQLLCLPHQTERGLQVGLECSLVLGRFTAHPYGPRNRPRKGWGLLSPLYQAVQPIVPEKWKAKAKEKDEAKDENFYYVQGSG